MLYKVGKFVVVCEWVGKEVLDMRQNERKIEFIRVGDAVRIVGRFQGKLTLNRSPWSIFISRVQGTG